MRLSLGMMFQNFSDWDRFLAMERGEEVAQGGHEPGRGPPAEHPAGPALKARRVGADTDGAGLRFPAGRTNGTGHSPGGILDTGKESSIAAICVKGRIATSS